MQIKNPLSTFHSHLSTKKTLFGGYFHSKGSWYFCREIFNPKYFYYEKNL